MYIELIHYKILTNNLYSSYIEVDVASIFFALIRFIVVRTVMNCAIFDTRLKGD